ncbi:Riboflavin synthase [invertebrate metagenome]|uniref:Riboflavin synthase n=1 Tax=invertebrate metagenome TaxID=1711999 RepID=A0A2H9T481_9ZZZZ
MFTGIVEATGTVHSMQHQQGDVSLHIVSDSLDMKDIQLGDSIATSGVCLTVTQLSGHGYIADVSKETLQLTTLGHLSTGSLVNLERALTPTSRLGGHLVSGHVDGIGKVLSAEPSARSVRFWLEAPFALARYIAHKGSIAIDGISLTVNEVGEGAKGGQFSVNIVPHTQQKTTIAHWKPGQNVNLEVDQVARYLERLMDPALRETATQPTSPITKTLLANNGFLR